VETDTQTHTHTHTDTQAKYSNPRCACAPRVNYITKLHASSHLTNYHTDYIIMHTDGTNTLQLNGTAL